jgi:hypothetical protein
VENRHGNITNLVLPPGQEVKGNIDDKRAQKMEQQRRNDDKITYSRDPSSLSVGDRSTFPESKQENKISSKVHQLFPLFDGSSTSSDSHPTAARRRTVFSSLRPQLWKTRAIPQEEPKAVIEQDWRKVLMRSLFQILPAVGCIALIAIHLRDVVVPHRSAYAILQFVAKAHEVLMLASIVIVLLFHIRHELVEAGGAPFGSLFAATSISNISYLWSPEMQGTLTNEMFRGRRKVLLVTHIFISFFLAASVGPSSAILMLPRQFNLPVVRCTLSINWDEMFPTQIDPTMYAEA